MSTVSGIDECPICNSWPMKDGQLKILEARPNGVSTWHHPQCVFAINIQRKAGLDAGRTTEVAGGRTEGGERLSETNGQ